MLRVEGSRSNVRTLFWYDDVAASTPSIHALELQAAMCVPTLSVSSSSRIPKLRLGELCGSNGALILMVIFCEIVVGPMVTT